MFKAIRKGRFTRDKVQMSSVYRLFLWRFWSMVLSITWVCGVYAEQLHLASGMRFPNQIEHTLVLNTADCTSLTNDSAIISYSFPDGQRVLVRVYLAPKGAMGPTRKDGDSSSDPTPVFMSELQRLQKECIGSAESQRIVKTTRFLCAPQQKGPIGMRIISKAVLTSGESRLYDIILCERNKYMVCIYTNYREDEYMKYGSRYTDVANFIIWPPKGNKHNKQDK